MSVPSRFKPGDKVAYVYSEEHEPIAFGDRERFKRIVKVGLYLGLVNHGPKYRAAKRTQLARVQFIGNKTVSRIPLRELKKSEEVTEW